MSDHVTVIAGLGNPGDRYERTLHNAGFWFVEELARRFGMTDFVNPADPAARRAWLQRAQEFFEATRRTGGSNES